MSIKSVLSQITLASFIFRISFSWSEKKNTINFNLISTNLFQFFFFFLITIHFTINSIKIYSRRNILLYVIILKIIPFESIHRLVETCFPKIYKFLKSVRYLGSKEFLLTESEGRWLVRQLIPKSVASTGITELRGDYTGEGWPEHATRKWSLRYTTGPEIDVSWMPEDQYTHRYFREFRIQFLEMMVTNIFRKWFTIYYREIL